MDETIPVWTPEELWKFNDKLIEQGRSHCVWIGVVWDTIEADSLWKDRGYETYTQCVEKEGPRAYSTVMECVRNYRFFVLGDRLAFPEYLQLVLEQGIYKVSVIRQAMALERPHVDTEPEAEEPQVQAIAERIAPLGVRAAHMILVSGGLRSITRRLTWSEEIDKFYVEATDHIQSRVGQPITKTYALGLLLGEYCATKAMRKPLRVWEGQ